MPVPAEQRVRTCILLRPSVMLVGHNNRCRHGRIVEIPWARRARNVIHLRRERRNSRDPRSQGFFLNYAATTVIRPAFRERGFRRITISTSWSSAVKRFIRRSTEKPSSL